MFIALNPTLLAGGKVGWPEIARLAARLGYPGVDVSLGPAMKEGVNETKALFEHLRLKPARDRLPGGLPQGRSGFRGGARQAGRRRRSSPRRSAARACAPGSCPRATRRRPSCARIYLKRFRAAADDAGALGRRGWGSSSSARCTCASRTRTSSSGAWTEMVEFAAECGPNVGLLLDSWHWHHAGATAGGHRGRRQSAHRPRARERRAQTCRPNRSATTTASCPARA